VRGDRADRVDRLLRTLDRAWASLQESYAGLSDAQLERPGVVGDWSIKDVLAHVTTWEQEALKYLPLIAAGGRPPKYSTTEGGIDAFNERMHQQKRSLGLAEVRAEAVRTHEQLVALIRAAPVEQLSGETRWRRRLRIDTYAHYAEHAEAIRAWREALPSSA
jgi:hypothetical protein